MSNVVNGHKTLSERIAHHTEEKNLPGGWQVLKFGGTSVGKFAENIAGIVRYVKEGGGKGSGRVEDGWRMSKRLRRAS